MNLSIDQVTVHSQDRKSLALRATPDGLVALVPHKLDPEGEKVRRFVERGITRLPELDYFSGRLTRKELEKLIATWTERLGVEVERVQLRDMRTKWASCSSRGTLTLHHDLLRMPQELVNYILCHELLHRKVPNHNQSWQLLMGIHLPDWRERERRLAAWMLKRVIQTQ